MDEHSLSTGSDGIHFTWKPDWPAVKNVLPLIEGALAPFDVRPHWGKLFTMPGMRIEPRYAMLPSCKKLLAQYDLPGKFRNRFIEDNLYAT